MLGVVAWIAAGAGLRRGHGRDLGVLKVWGRVRVRVSGDTELLQGVAAGLEVDLVAGGALRVGAVGVEEQARQDVSVTYDLVTVASVSPETMAGRRPCRLSRYRGQRCGSGRS